MERIFLFVTMPLLAVSLVLSGCAPDPNDTQINARIKSPDGKLEAVYAEDIGGGPAVGVSEEVFVVEPGAFPRLNERIFSMECARNIGFTWETPRTLKVTYHIGSDISDNTELNKPSIFSVFSSGYWTYDKPHDVQVRFVRLLDPAGNGC